MDEVASVVHGASVVGADGWISGGSIGDCEAWVDMGQQRVTGLLCHNIWSKWLPPWRENK